MMKCPEHDMTYMLAPVVSSLTLLSGWSAQSETALQGAMDMVVLANPFLAGKLISAGPSGEVGIEPMVHSATLKVVDGPADFVVSSKLPEQLAATQALESLFPALATGNEALGNGSPLFSVAVATLPGGFACLCVQMSHMLGDGSSYYQVCALLNAAANGLPLPRLEWVPSPKSAAIAPHFTADDEFTMLKSWLPGFMAKLETFKSRAVATILDTAALKELKAEYTAQAGGKVEYLSSNDIIVAGLNEVSEATLSSMYANMRNRKDQGTDTAHYAGNFERSILYPKAAAANNPVYVRSKLATDFNHYEAEELPKGPLAKCDLMLNTSWCQLTNFVEPPGCEVIVHVPPTLLVTTIPCEFVVCFKVDKKGTTGLLHNMDLDDPAYQARIAASSIFRRMAPSSVQNKQLASFDGVEGLAEHEEKKAMAEYVGLMTASLIKNGINMADPPHGLAQHLVSAAALISKK